MDEVQTTASRSGWSSGFGGLPGQQPDGQVDEAQPAVGVCRGVLVEEVVQPVGQGESGDCQY